MIIVIKKTTGKNAITNFVNSIGLEYQALVKCDRCIYLITKHSQKFDDAQTKIIKNSEIVIDTFETTNEYQLVDRKTSRICAPKIVVKNHEICSANKFCIFAGPCSVESPELIFDIAKKMSALGVKILRGGTFKSRTSPYGFQGLGLHALKLLHQAAIENNLLSITEILDTRDVEKALDYVDIIQIGTRNMYNYPLIREAAKTGKPLLLKRGFSATYKEFLLAAEYAYLEGNSNIILCERGIKTFEPYTRNTLDITAVPVLQHLSHLPVIIDPSHSSGFSYLVPALARAAVAVGANGMIIEVHTNPSKALSDGEQSVNIETFEKIIKTLSKIAKSLDMEIA